MVNKLFLIDGVRKFLLNLIARMLISFFTLIVGLLRHQYNKGITKKGVYQMERTLVIIKPDGVRRHLIGRIIQRFEEKGLAITEMKFATMTKELAQEHYHHLSGRSFFDELIDYMTSGPVVYLVLAGEDVIDIVRKIVGATKAVDAVPGTIRGDYALPGTENIIHASDSRDAATNEINRFFPLFDTKKQKSEIVHPE